MGPFACDWAMGCIGFALSLKKKTILAVFLLRKRYLRIFQKKHFGPLFARIGFCIRTFDKGPTERWKFYP